MNSKVLIMVFVIIVLILVFAITIFAIKKDNANFNNEKQAGTAIIVGHATNSSSNNVRYMVKVLDSGDENSYNLKGVYNVKNINGDLDTSYPHFDIGDEVKVLYAPQKVAGIRVIDVRIDRNAYDYPN